MDKPVHVVIITPDQRAGRFSGSVSVKSGGLTITVEPVICGPDHVPVITDLGAWVRAAARVGSTAELLEKHPPPAT